MAADAGVVRVNNIYAAERDEARAARHAMTEMDRCRSAAVREVPHEIQKG